MPIDVSPDEIRRAKIPHELFLTNLIGNHILMAVAAGGVAGSMPWIMALIPVISFALLGYLLWRARRARERDPWYVMCHWAIGARRARILIAMLSAALAIAVVSWLAHAFGGLMKEAAIALAVGGSLLPVMVSVLALVILESDALHQAGQGKLPAWASARFPCPETGQAAQATDAAPLY